MGQINNPSSLTRGGPLGGGAIISSLGDSISGRSDYQTISPQNVPAWTPLTLYLGGNEVSNANYIYRATSASGTSAASGGPTGVVNGITDGTVTWNVVPPFIGKGATSHLFWAEKFSNGNLFWDMSRSYNGLANGLFKVIVINGGSNYTAPTVSFNAGAGTQVTLNVVSGVIVSGTVVNPGYNTTGSLTGTITDATGTGAILSYVFNTNGTFAMPGCRTRDMVARLPDVLAAGLDIITVLGGTNDITLDVTSYATATTTAASIIANLQTIYETCTAAGIRVIAIPITPRSDRVNYQIVATTTVNNWIYGYVKRARSLNPNNTNIALADPTGYWTDGTAAYSTVGGAGGVAGAVTLDGIHPSPRGAQYIGYVVSKAAEEWVGATPAYTAREYSFGEGYDLTYNPNGNIFEGVAWKASTPYALGSLVSNDTGGSPSGKGRVYRLSTAGTSAASGGPTGTGASIADGSAVWAYLRESGMSVLASGTAGTKTNPAGSTSITISGNLATGLTLSRSSGATTTAGTITCAIENPWSNGQTGQRQSISFSLGSGGSATTDLWRVLISNPTIANSGLQASDLGTFYYVAECEVELSGIANLCGIYLEIFGQGTVSAFYDGASEYSLPIASATATGYQMINSTGDPVTYPNGGKIYFRTQPAQLCTLQTSLNIALFMAFDVSGAADTATLVAKINYLAFRKVAV